MNKSWLNALLKQYAWRPGKLADALGIDRGAITKWGERGIPDDRIEQIHNLTKIPEWKLAVRWMEDGKS